MNKETTDSLANHAKKPIELYEITTLKDEAVFQSRLEKVIKKAQRDKIYLQRLRDHPAETLNDAELQLVPGLKLKIVPQENRDEVSLTDSANCEDFILYVPPKAPIKPEDLSKVAGGFANAIFSAVGQFGVQVVSDLISRANK